MDKGERDEIGESARFLLEGFQIGVALVRPCNWGIVFENERFRSWLPETGENLNTLASRIGEFDGASAQVCLDGNDSYRFEAMARQGSRPKPLQVLIHRLPGPWGAHAMVECIDISRQHEIGHMMESYSEIIEKEHLDLGEKMRGGEKLLGNMLPGFVRRDLENQGVVAPRRFERLTTLMLDFVDFTESTMSQDLAHVVMVLNDIYTAFDQIADASGCERIKTIGDAFLAVPALPDPGVRSTIKVARMALRMRDYIKDRNRTHPEQWACRIGIATGSAIGAIVGAHRLAYDVFGPCVNLASRLEGLAAPMQSLVCEKTRELSEAEFSFDEWGEAGIKGFGSQVIHELLG